MTIISQIIPQKKGRKPLPPTFLTYTHHLNLRTLRAGVTVVLVSIVPFLASSPISDELWRPKIPLGLDLYLPVPEDNPLTREKVELGRKLFFDPLLSRDQTLSCAGCHDPERAFTDGRAISEGVFGRKGTRSVPTLVNRGYGRAFFWDGRISSLEEQVLQPIQDSKEMDMTLQEILTRLRKEEDYRQGFREAFRTEVNSEGVAKALSEDARQGLEIFHGKGNCAACHIGPNFTDERFHNTGVAWPEGELLDPGRFAVTGKEADRGAFKTPTLREVALTAPYMHDGSIATLENVIEFYTRGGNPNPHLDEELRPLRLTAEEKEALLDFLKSLSGEISGGL